MPAGSRRPGTASSRPKAFRFSSRKPVYLKHTSGSRFSTAAARKTARRCRRPGASSSPAAQLTRQDQTSTGTSRSPPQA